MWSFFKKWFGRGELTRSSREALRVRQETQTAINSQLLGMISCPWHQETDTKSCRFDKTTGVVQCTGCKRTTDLEGLWRRLGDREVYERAVE